MVTATHTRMVTYIFGLALLSWGGLFIWRDLHWNKVIHQLQQLPLMYHNGTEPAVNVGTITFSDVDSYNWITYPIRIGGGFAVLMYGCWLLHIHRSMRTFLYNGSRMFQTVLTIVIVSICVFVPMWATGNTIGPDIIPQPGPGWEMKDPMMSFYEGCPSGTVSLYQRLPGHQSLPRCTSAYLINGNFTINQCCVAYPNEVVNHADEIFHQYGWFLGGLMLLQLIAYPLTFYLRMRQKRSSNIDPMGNWRPNERSSRTTQV